MRLAVLALAMFSAPAAAEVYYEKWLGSVGSASMAAETGDATLYRSPSGQTAPFVKVTIGENDYLFALMTNSKTIWISDRVAKDQGLSFKSKNKKAINLKGKENKFRELGEIKVSQLDKLTIGDLVLENLGVSNFSKKEAQTDAAQGGRAWYKSRKSALAVDGAIGLNALPDDINWAVLPSEGVVRFTRGSAHGLEGGTQLAVTHKPALMEPFGKPPFSRHIHRSATDVAGGVNVAGVEMPAVVELGLIRSMTIWPNEVPAVSVVEVGDIPLKLTEVKFGSQDMGTVRVAAHTGYDLINRKTQEPFTVLDEINMAYLGQDLLWAYDVARDRTAGTLTFKRADDVKRESPLPFMIAEALKAVAPEEAEGEDAQADKAEISGENAEPTIPGSSEAWSRLAELHEAANQWEAALTAAANATTFNDRDCTGWSRLGKLQLRTGDYAAAVTSLEKASELYHAWYDMPLEERKELKKALDKLEGDEKKTAEHHPASGSCHTADGNLAAAKFGTGDVVAIEKLYRNYFDLDRHLATVTGNALIVHGELDNAVEPLRQSLKIPGPNPAARLSLGVVFAEQGEWAAAEKLLMRANKERGDVQGLLVWSDALAEAKGEDVRVDALRAIIKNYPDADAPRVALAYALSGSENAVMKAKTERASRSFFKQSVQLAKVSNERQGNYARWLNQWKPGSDEALAAAEKAVSLNGASANAQIAMAEVLSARGDAAKAAEWTQRAAKSSAGHIGYARLINQ
jgi:tetratricopeptide (TPR) repeat protein